MTSETQLAFDHPEARSLASATGPLDRLSLRNHIVDVEIGAFQAERDMTQRLSFNLVVEIAPLPADLDDDVDRILSYDRLTEAISYELAAERLNLLETLSERIAARVLLEPQAQRVFVRIEKLDRGPGALGVEIVRSKTETAPEPAAASAAATPKVVFLSPDTFDSVICKKPAAKFLADILLEDGPVVFALPAAPVASVADTAAQFHIDLLAIEQNAWRLAAQENALRVVSSRAELDWAVREQQKIIWAPSKMVLDSVEGPPALGPAGGLSLAAWLARECEASAFVAIGVASDELAGEDLADVAHQLVDLEQREP
ncbi:diguanylate cyclase [Epibacterium sp. SM1969]|uniref:Diguanylate cyclase n=1 Tax=Tritonibacter aquimaris TaxID=2663379 RepID=A0A844B167_9RHOB|nr:dihydroneopterin aldolase [Tritonibacter aquimaris]MQY43136.1 diguanylate cyclase [Tritonibacter aquimaris]